MRGIYVNCDESELSSSLSVMSEESRLLYFPKGGTDGCVVYDSNSWPTPPIEYTNHGVFIISGWFIYKQQLNPLALLAKDIIEEGVDVLNNILAGVFVLFWEQTDQQVIFTDALGLSNHYIDKHADTIRVAPSVKALVTEEHPLNEKMKSILAKKNHLFGNFTLFDGIKRLSPGTVTKIDSELSYIKFYEPQPLEELGEYVTELTKYWDYNQRILPLSSGLDSRYLLANGSYKYGFTYGPDNSPEVEIAGRFQQDFNQYFSFDYNKEPLHDKEAQILGEMAYGTLNPIPRLFTNYLYVSKYYSQAKVFFDGYLGDLFQRGTYINFKGKRGEILKLLPWTYRFFSFKSQTLLRLRYKELNKDEFNILWYDFKNKTDSLKLNDYQKVTYYEFLYGRGGRYTIFGSNVLAAQFFTVVSPFASRRIFDSFIQQDYAKAVSYKALKRIWQNAAIKYKRAPVESGYSPCTNPFFIPFIQLAYRLMFHFIPSRANYGVKLKRLEKGNK